MACAYRNSRRIQDKNDAPRGLDDLFQHFQGDLVACPILVLVRSGLARDSAKLSTRVLCCVPQLQVTPNNTVTGVGFPLRFASRFKMFGDPPSCPARRGSAISASSPRASKASITAGAVAGCFCVHRGSPPTLGSPQKMIYQEVAVSG